MGCGGISDKVLCCGKGVPVIHWSTGKLEKFITSNVEDEYRRPFRDLLDKAHRLSLIHI